MATGDESSPIEEVTQQRRGDASISQEYDGVKFASFWRRLLAYLLDYAICSVALTSIAVLIGTIFSNWGAAEASVYILYLPTLWLYRTLLESSRTQATVGKMALAIVVTDLKLERIGFGRANARFWSRILSFYTAMIGFIMAAFTKRKQALHDKIAGTLVINKRAPLSN